MQRFLVFTVALFVSAALRCRDKKEVTTDSGLKYVELKPGDGAVPRKGEWVQVHYTGWLADGTKFDSSVDRGKPFKFKLGFGGSSRAGTKGSPR